MTLLLKDSGLGGLKGTVQYCADCGKPTVHYRAPGGWPICSTCGYNAELMELYEANYQARSGDASAASVLISSRSAA